MKRLKKICFFACPLEVQRTELHLYTISVHNISVQDNETIFDYFASEKTKF